MENHDTPLHKLQEHIHSLAPVVQWLKEHPELNDASVAWGTKDRISLYVDGFGARGAERFAVAVRALKDDAPLGSVRREDDDSFTTFERDFGAVRVSVYTSRAAVCERVVIGTETVEVPDPAAPKVAVERDVVEWKCRPILAGADALAEPVGGGF